ncbi:hypothetical protein Rs2_44291 [Raphanus sativus]|nr:hypothetical protein Rs2_44291 [Raphanus sativus]
MTEKNVRKKNPMSLAYDSLLLMTKSVSFLDCLTTKKKKIRELVHLKITMNAICDPVCKGMCLKCVANLNKRTCGCGNEENDKGYGPLGNPRKQMQQSHGQVR